MRIVGRLALQTPSGIGIVPSDESRLKSEILSFRGCDIVVSGMSECGFEAKLSIPLKKGALVRLRLPVAGAMLAKVVSCQKGLLKAEFVNPVSAARLGQTLGLSRLAPLAAFA
jgi:hypothetical protein